MFRMTPSFPQVKCIGCIRQTAASEGWLAIADSGALKMDITFTLHRIVSKSYQFESGMVPRSAATTRLSLWLRNARKTNPDPGGCHGAKPRSAETARRWGGRQPAPARRLPPGVG